VRHSTETRHSLLCDSKKAPSLSFLEEFTGFLVEHNDFSPPISEVRACTLSHKRITLVYNMPAKPVVSLGGILFSETQAKRNQCRTSDLTWVQYAAHEIPLVTLF
jgi:hypothetical protein